ncbi:hypothetical protein BN2497_10489 [Janthinobacterium sp. CG23_2]|nr:hypothetical protein BN2497_49 [Janthinobacterium sp. CG23_2]CUI07856.1 hypothetical protein BN2497_10489 [Janthinobacterium sp. CG23_2]CUU26422.1 hypothetical protein BN3177_49 [Janthinobacterium sp. CG23_2]CUU31642.1 hypothetical protein BN3177_10489 [Janthinobacterium sp. CG23_2]
MRTATNHAGYAVERHDGPIVGWTAISQTFTTPELAQQHLETIPRTPGAEYRVYVALGAKA